MRTVLINGGSRGIWRQLVLDFCKRGYKVAFTYKNSRDMAEELAKETGAIAIAADSASEEDVTAAVRCAVSAIGEIDILINNAAYSSYSLIQDLTLAEWERTIGTNLTGPFLFSRAVIPAMVRRGFGRIINISSMWGIVGSSCEAHYSASKAGLIGLTKALAKELGPSGITVNAVAPGVIKTDMNSALDEETISALIDETPVSRLGDASDVSRAVLFLASDESGFVTGEVMNVSGGFIV